jgi:hypothetical protein
MNIVISHEGTDFDALASMFAVSKLYPGTRIIIGGSVNRNVRRFLTLYGTFFNYSIEKELDWKSVKKIWIVDASSPSRSGKAEELIQAGRVAFAIYDHHPETPDGLKGEQVVVQPTGACTTILVELIKEQTLPLNSLEATLLILGIYEDTGSLTFPTTTARDLQAAAFLVEHGAKLSAIPDYVNMQLTNEQRDVLKLMVNSLTVVEVNGIQVHFTSVQVKDYVDGIWVGGGAINNGGIVYSWMNDLLNDNTQWEIDPQRPRPLFLPFLTGERSPNWNAQARGVLFGLSYFHTKEALMQSAFEGIAFRIRSIFELLKDIIGDPLQVVVNGGFGVSPKGSNILSHVLGIPLQLSEFPSAPCRGTFFLTLKVLNQIKSLDEISQKNFNQLNILQPNLDYSAFYDRLYRFYEKVYQANRGLFQEFSEFHLA